MTVAEMIALLSKHPPEMPVVVRGFDEHGYDDADIKQQMERIVRRRNFSPHGSQYQDSFLGSPQENEGEPFTAILIDW